ncbi:GTP-binding protein Rho1 [Serendipita sp. 399]|nr:GTP-binding protein Rho1 [Serendipita sp. 399]
MDYVLVNVPIFSRLVPLVLCDAHLSPGQFNPNYLGMAVFVGCFSIGDPHSFADGEDVSTHNNGTTFANGKKRKRTLPIMLVGCKKDVRTESEESNKDGTRRFISVEEGRVMARRLGAMMYLECSAKTGEGVDEVFYHAARLSLLYANDTVSSKR